MKIKKAIVSLIITVFFSIIFTSKSEAQSITVKGTFLNSSHSKIYVNVPVEGKYFAGANLEFPINTLDNSFNFKINDIEKPGLMTLSNGFSNFYLFIQPNGHYELECKKTGCQIAGTESEGQMALQKLLIFRDPKMLFHSIDSIENVNDRKATIEKKYHAMSAVFNTMLNNKKITPQFHQWILWEIDAAAKNWMATNLFFKFRIAYKNETLKKDFMNTSLPVWASLFETINHDTAVNQSSFLDYFLSRYKAYLDVKTDGYLNFEEGTFETRLLTGNILTGSTLEYAWAGYMVEGISRNLFEKKWVDNFRAFKKQFPKSKLTPWILPYIEKIIAYHENAKKNDSEIVFVEEASTFNSLDTLLSTLKGNYFYVDLWATWCGPCREELQYSKDLHEELRKMGVQTVYLSVDGEKDAQKWREMVKNLQLRGINMRANEALYKNIRENLSQFVGIPHYFIVDKNGKIVVGKAERPSSQNLLIEQLREIIK